MTKPKYFGNKIRSINLWFDVCGTKFGVLIPLTPIAFSLEMEKLSMKVECPAVSSSSLLPNLQSSFSFLEEPKCPISPSLYHLKMNALLGSTYFILLTDFESDTVVVPIL